MTKFNNYKVIFLARYINFLKYQGNGNEVYRYVCAFQLKKKVTKHWLLQKKKRKEKKYIQNEYVELRNS